jgi:nucleoside-diphosphate kinase
MLETNRISTVRWSSVLPMDRTFIICKPDAVERGLVGEILGRFEARSLKIAAAELRTIDRATAETHYGEHADKPFFGELVEFITRGPALVAVIEGPEDTWQVVRTMMGATNPRDAAPGTIRGDLGILFTENLIHGSDGPESAQREIALFFPGL